MNKFLIKIITVSFAFLLMGSSFNYNVMALASNIDGNGSESQLLDADILIDEDFKRVYDLVNQIPNVANFYHSSHDIDTMCVNLFDKDIHLLDAPIDQIDLNHVTRIFMDAFKYEFSDLEEFDRYLAENYNSNILEFWDNEAFWNSQEDDDKHFFYNDTLYSEIANSLERIEDTKTKVPGMLLVSKENQEYLQDNDNIEMVVIIKNIATYDFGKPLHLRIDYQGKPNADDIKLLEDMRWSTTKGEANIKMQFLDESGKSIKIMIHQLMSDIDNGEIHSLIPASYEPSKYSNKNPTAPLFFIKKSDTNIQQDSTDLSIFTGGYEGIDEDVDPNTKKPLVYPKGCVSITAVDDTFIYKTKPFTDFMWYRTNLTSPRALANYYVDIADDPKVYGQNDGDPRWLKNPYRIYVDSNPDQVIEKNNYTYKFINSKVQNIKDGDDPRFSGNIIHYYKKQKVTRFLEQDNVTNVLEKAVIGEEFVDQKDTIIHNGKKYVYVDSSKVNDYEKIYYYKVSKQLGKVTKFVDINDKTTEIKQNITADEFAKEDDKIIYNNQEYVYVNSDEVNDSEKIHYYKLREVTTRFLEKNNESNVLQNDVIDNKVIEKIDSIVKAPYTYKFVETVVNGDVVKHLYNIELLDLKEDNVIKKKVTKFLTEQGNIELKTAIIADEFAKEDDKIIYNNQEYVYVNSDEVNDSEKIHYYKLREVTINVIKKNIKEPIRVSVPNTSETNRVLLPEVLAIVASLSLIYFIIKQKYNQS